MNKAILFLSCILILMTPVSAVNVNVKLYFIDSNSTSGSLSYILKNVGTNQSMTDRILLTDSFTIQAMDGYNIIDAYIDDTNTEGDDFYGESSFYSSEGLNISITMFPIGSAIITVTDKDNNPLKDVPVRIDCTKNYGVQGYFRTDSLGIVVADNLPAGVCTIRTAFADASASKIINIAQGDKDSVTINLDYSQKENVSSSLVIVIVIVLMVIVAIYYFRNSKKTKSKDTVPEPSTSAAKDDIVTALGKKEQQVVKYMLEEFATGKKYVSQANIVYGAKIPKTSLARVLESLQQKRIIEIEKIGKLKKISFSDWFKSR